MTRALARSSAARSRFRTDRISIPTATVACGSCSRQSSGSGVGGKLACALPCSIAALFSLPSRVAQDEIDISAIKAPSAAGSFKQAFIFCCLLVEAIG